MTEISQDELYILDPEMVLTETVGTSPAIPDLVDSDEQRQFSFSSSLTSPSTPTNSNRSDSKIGKSRKTREEVQWN